MIKHLDNDFETVEYDAKQSVMLYDNVQFEEYPVHWHSEIEIVMPLRNNYYMEIAGKKHEVKEHEVFIIPSCELHHLLACEGRRMIFQFDCSVLNSNPIFSPLMRCISSPLHITPEYDEEIHIIAKKGMLKIFDLYKSDSELAEAKIYNIIIYLLIAIRDFEKKKQFSLAKCADDKINEYSKVFDRVFKYIDNNYMYDITLDDLADISGYSKYHFSRIFKQYSSVSYSSYLNERRIRAAEDMLLNSEVSVTEIAVRSGFKSLATFNRVFRKIKRCTPSEFKKLYEI